MAADIPAGAHARALTAALGEPGFAGWATLPFFADGTAAALCARLDGRVAAGAHVLPAPAALFRALHLAPREAVRVVILGQDPYPTPGHADGLAFSHAGGGWLPASLARIFRERASDLGLRDRTSEGLAPRPATGDLSGWARQGVLLLNASLSVETGRAGSHLAWGWQALARDVIAALGAGGPKARPVVFILWGNAARAMGAGIDRVAHLVIESAHPSPLAARGDFLGSRPFSRANAFLIGRGLPPIDWLAGPGHA